jgi:hypothetical protein
MRASRFDHFLLYGPDVEGVTRFFTQILDFSVAERIETPDGTLAVWLTCSTKAHDIAFVKHEAPGKFHHVAFLLESWNDVGHAADVTPAITSRSISDLLGMASRGGRRFTSSIHRETATRSSPAVIAITLTTPFGYGPPMRLGKAFFTTRKSSTIGSSASLHNESFRLRRPGRMPDKKEKQLILALC